MEDHEGYSNKPTQLVSAWIHNKEESRKHWHTLARNLSVDALSAELKDHYGNIRNPLLNNKNIMYKELLDYSLEMVNWREISKILIGEVSK
jgi:hypothetical protein